MSKDSLQTFIEEVQPAWGPLDTDLAARCRGLLATLAQAPTSEPWLADLLRDLPESRELHRDPERGFILLAHAGKWGHYRPPHDHGRGWVVYAVQSGEMEMGTFAKADGSTAETRLVKREAYRLGAGECRIYLPGDIHDARYISDDILVFRFTSCDLGREEREGRLARYPGA